MITKYGVYYELNESPFDFIIKNEKHTMKLYFSSKFTREKYERLITNFINDETIKNQNKFGFPIKWNFTIYLLLYLKVEKRGFYCEIDNIPIRKNDIIIDINIV